MKSVFLLVFASLCLISKAQLPDYYVYLVQGTVSIYRPSSQVTTVKQHDLLFDGDELVLKPGSEITLVDRGADFILLRSTGRYRINNLPRNNSINKTDGLTKKYLKLLWGELLDPNEDYTKFKKENLTEIAGSVSRGDVYCGNLVFPFNGLKTSRETIHFTWLQTSPSSNYTFFIYDSEGKEVVKMNTKDTQQLITRAQIPNSGPGKYYWIVKSNDATCEDEIPLYFELVTKEAEVRATDSIASINGDTDLSSQLQVINRLEKNGLIDAASDYYVRLIKANQHDAALRKSYVLFLLKYGFNEDALSAWNSWGK